MFQENQRNGGEEINGIPSLVIPVNGEVKINGIEVELK